MAGKGKSEIAGKLGKITRLYGLRITSLCSQYSIPFSSLYTYSAQNMPASVRQKLAKLCKDYWICLDWLLSGKGMPLLDLPCDFLPLVNIDLDDVQSLKEYIRKSARSKFWATTEEWNAWIFQYLGKIHSKLNTYREELVFFKEIVQTYFSKGVEGLSYKQRKKIFYYTSDQEIVSLLQLEDNQRFSFKEFWERYVKGEMGMALNPDAPFLCAYKELTQVMLFDAKVPNHAQLTNRPTLCPQCLKVVCPAELRESGGRCPFCGEKILEFVWGV